MKTSTPECLCDDIGLTLSSYGTVKFTFCAFYKGIVYGHCRRFGAKVNKYSEIAEQKNLDALGGKIILTLNQCLLYFDSFKPSGLFR